MKIKEQYFYFIFLSLTFFSFTIISKKFASTKNDEYEISSYDNNIKKALFPSKNNIIQVMLDLIKNEKKSIKAAIFLITNKQIANALIDAKKRNIEIDIITCCSNLNNIIDQLVENDISVHVFGITSSKKASRPLMHNKFFIFEKNVNDKSILWTGSFNLTYNAQLKNKENVLIIEDEFLISQYLDEYEMIKKQTKSLTKIHNKKKLKSQATKTAMPLLEKFKKTFKIAIS